jgi:hypothetical protein
MITNRVFGNYTMEGQFEPEKEQVKVSRISKTSHG